MLKTPSISTAVIIPLKSLSFISPPPYIYIIAKNISTINAAMAITRIPAMTDEMISSIFHFLRFLVFSLGVEANFTRETRKNTAEMSGMPKSAAIEIIS